VSRLNDKINSYTLRNGLELNQTYSIPPTQTGSNQSTSAGDWEITGNVAISDANSGPQPGTRSWRFDVGPSFGASRLRGEGPIVNSWDYGSYSYGFWMKINTWLDFEDNAPNFAINRLEPIFTIGNYTAFGYDRDPDSPTYGKKWFIFFADGQATVITSVNGEDLEEDRWYYIAFRRDGEDLDVYVNGTHVGFIWVNEYPVEDGTWLNLGSVASGFGVDFSMSFANIYVAAYEEIDADDISAIWDYGSPIQAPVKYWDGSAWQTASDIKVYDGTNWSPVYANRWTGSAWLPV